MNRCLLLLLLVFIVSVVSGQDRKSDPDFYVNNCRIFLPLESVVLVHRNGSELSLEEKDVSFLRKVGKPDKEESGREDMALNYDYILYKNLFYKRDGFYFIYPGGG